MEGARAGQPGSDRRDVVGTGSVADPKGDTVEPLCYDPDAVTLKYTLRHDYGGPDRAGGTYGTLWANDREALETWEVKADEETFELDPCSCGCPGCGLFEAQAHRAGPYIVWTAWERRHEEPADVGHLPLVFRRDALEATLGGDAGSLPELTTEQAWRLLDDNHRWRPLGDEPAASWRWAHVALAGHPAVQVAHRLAALPTSELVGASLHRAPGTECTLTSGTRAIDVALIDDALALRCGPLRRFGLFLRVPRLTLGAPA
jgi:hypothetical protein